jgi:hypothetical protein
MKYEIKHYEGLNYTPALKIAVAGHMELLNRELCSPTVLLHHSYKAFVATQDNADEPGEVAFSEEVVGVLVYEHREYDKELSIILGYVYPAFRQRGVYALLWEHAVTKAQELKCHHITGGTHVNNANMQRMMGNQFRQLTGMFYEYRIKP